MTVAQQQANPAEGVVLRDLEWTDLARLAELEQQLFADDAWAEATWWSELAGRPRRDYVVATTADGTIAGYAGLDVSGDVADVMTIATAPGHQGRGTGRVLLDELVRRATSHGVEALLLEVRADNDAARRLYDRAGFEVISVRRRYYQPGDVDALVMRLLVTKGDA
ncbi:ribosomal protein S18-alanine N-acetyltransferase [Terrabacter aerolatus]|uniref:Ribosomal-protein-alanine acetyltransferase n=1 Tax=Terrabacter aerolatus TaxID=422442 RepID=A0A512D003_9MICO|nr:ribosomal protein S18-alanine N-acetyltransferase [Terrabacter aerolatus]GEO29789.1 ribosomal-protein-alanine acetyltransferase [Terrabacter aerolatus]